MAAVRQDGTSKERRRLLDQILSEKDGVRASPKKTRHSTVIPYALPILSPNDRRSFCQMFDKWMVDDYRFQARPARPGPTVTELTAGDRSSERIAEYGDGAIGVLKSDCFGRTYLVDSRPGQSKPRLANNPEGRAVKRSLLDDYNHRRDLLRAWWDKRENQEAALDIQRHYMLELDRLLRLDFDNPAPFQRSIAAFATQWNDLRHCMDTIFEKNLELAGPSAGLNPLSQETASTGLPFHPGANCICESCESVKSANLFRMPFAMLANMFRFYYGLKLLWEKLDENRVPFHFDAKVLLVDLPEPGSFHQPLDRIMPPKWHVEDISVPLDCDWEMLEEYLDTAFPTDDDACDSHARLVAGALVDNLVKLDKETLAAKYGPGFKSIKKPFFSDLVRWRYSNLPETRSPDEIVWKKYGHCDEERGFRNIMELAKARNTIVLTRTSTISCIQFVTRLANGDRLWRGEISSLEVDSSSGTIDGCGPALGGAMEGAQ